MNFVRDCLFSDVDSETYKLLRPASREYFAFPIGYFIEKVTTSFEGLLLPWIIPRSGCTSIPDSKEVFKSYLEILKGVPETDLKPESFEALGRNFVATPLLGDTFNFSHGDLARILTTEYYDGDKSGCIVDPIPFDLNGGLTQKPKEIKSSKVFMADNVELVSNFFCKKEDFDSISKQTVAESELS